MFLADGSQDAHAEGVSYELCDVSRVGLLKQLSTMIFYGVGRYKQLRRNFFAVQASWKEIQDLFFACGDAVLYIGTHVDENLEINKLSSTKVAKINKR